MKIPFLTGINHIIFLYRSLLYQLYICNLKLAHKINYKVFLISIIFYGGITFSQVKNNRNKVTSNNYELNKISSVGNVSVNTWAGGKKAAFSFTFDDGYFSQYQYANPVLSSFGFKATYFVITSVVTDGPPVIYRYDTWPHYRELAAEGNEIGAHTVTHPDLTTLPVGNQYTPGTIEYELYQSQKKIEEEIPDQKCISLAYPFCTYNDNVRAAAHRYFQAARTCGSDTISSNIYGMDWYSVSSSDVLFDQPRKTLSDDQDEFNSYTGMLQNKLIPNGKWTVFLAHEVLPFSQISSGAADAFYYPVSTEWLTELCQWIKQKSDNGLIWVSTFGNVTRYIKERQNFSYTLLTSNSSEIQFSPVDGLDDSIYNYPLTVDVTVPAGWKNIRVSQGENVSDVSTYTDGSNNYAKIDIIPDGGVVTLSSSINSFELSGTVTYTNNEESPLANVTIALSSNGDTLKTVTGANGKYSFVNITPGTYTLTASKNDNWGGANSTDALLVLRYFANLVTLDNLQLKAADVSGNGQFNSTDALMIAQRFLGIINSFKMPDWVFSTPDTVTITNTSFIKNIKGLAAGDVNESYLP